MEDDYNIPVGTEELKKLEPKLVIIKEVEIEELQTKKNTRVKRLLCHVQHPDANDTILINEAKYAKNNVLVDTALWLNKDSKGELQKGSVISMLLAKLGAKTIKELEMKSCETVANAKGYLCFKLY